MRKIDSQVDEAIEILPTEDTPSRRTMPAAAS